MCVLYYQQLQGLPWREADRLGHQGDDEAS